MAKNNVPCINAEDDNADYSKTVVPPLFAAHFQKSGLMGYDHIPRAVSGAPVVAY